MEYTLVQNPEVYDKIIAYLEPFLDHEEGGYLLGKRVYNEDKSNVIITIEEFVPVKSSYSSWDITEEERTNLGLPAKQIGYYPDPNEAFKIAERVFPLNEKSDQVILGFAHNHMKYLPNPSVYDLSKVSRQFGYLMPIYSNSTKQLKIWVVTKEHIEEWESKKYGSLAQVELEATYLGK
jgi:hypothetical protein